MNRTTSAALSRSLQQSGISLRAVGIITAVVVVLAIVVRVAWGITKFALRHIVGVKL